MRTVNEILNEKKKLKEQAYEMIDLCKKEIRSFTEEENEKMLIIKKTLEELEQELLSANREDIKEVIEEKQAEELKEEAEKENQEPESKEGDPKEEEKEPEMTPENPEDESKEENENKNGCNESEETEKRNKNIDTKTVMEKRFSILTAIRNIANGQAQDEVTSAVLAQGNSEMRKAGLNFVGQIQLPAEARSLTVADEGEDVVATDFLDVVTPLQARNVMIQAGAKYLSGLVGDVQYPVMSNANCTWEGEVAKAKDGSPTFTNVKLSPKRLTTIVPISKQFLIQDSVGAENAIREEIINAINSKLEATILGTAAGTATQPAGLLNGTLPTVSDFAGLCNLEAGLDEANVGSDRKYIVSPKAKAALRNMAKSAKSTQLVYENDEIDGTEALCTSHVKDAAVVYGDFSQYIIAQWGNLDITVDNVTLAGEGQVRLVVNAYFDAKPLRREAFKAAKVGAGA